MGEYNESFTIDANSHEVRDLCIKYLTGFRYKLAKEQNNLLTFEKGSKSKNLYTFSFEEAYKQVALLIVGNGGTPVTTVSVSFTLPFLHLKKEEIEGMKSMIQSLKRFILISVGYRNS
jgi:hypothetical protein